VEATGDALVTVRPRSWAVIVAGGTGTRFGGRKQFASLAGRPVIAWSIDTARAVCSGVVVVLPADGDRTGDGGRAGDVTLAASLEDVAVVTGGTTRSDSVRAGLAAVGADAEIIVVHDAARPLAGLPLWSAVLEAVAGGADGAIPVVAIGDTIKMISPDGALATVDRTSLRAVQTPQAFRADLLRRAHAGSGQATDDATLVEAVGGRVVLVDGDPVNAKITVASDLVVAAALLSVVRA
jgi:2-C-methyl-D-erythritol 4-phosphate cytidylyltransferase